VCRVVDMYGCMPADVHSSSVTEHGVRSGSKRPPPARTQRLHGAGHARGVPAEPPARSDSGLGGRRAGSATRRAAWGRPQSTTNSASSSARAQRGPRTGW
jgi:hypothetical protein